MNTKIILLANGISLFASLVMVLIGFLRKKNQILVVQCFQFGLYTCANTLLGGYTGAFVNVLSLLRNVLCLKWKFTLPMKLFFILVQVVPSFFINDKGILGWLPVLAAILFTWFMDTEDDLTLKYVIIAGQSMWFFYDIVLFNFVSVLFDFITVIANIHAIRQMKKTLRQTDVDLDAYFD